MRSAEACKVASADLGLDRQPHQLAGAREHGACRAAQPRAQLLGHPLRPRRLSSQKTCVS
jgi:hypothetical protein